jgi:hypothetical protein
MIPRIICFFNVVNHECVHGCNCSLFIITLWQSTILLVTFYCGLSMGMCHSLPTVWRERWAGEIEA